MTRTKLSLTVFMLAAMAAFAGRAQAQGRADADWLFWNRGTGSDQTLIGGPGNVTAGDDSFGYDSGFRFSLGYGLGDYDIEAIFSQIPDWQSSGGTTLATPLVFDDPTNAFIPPPANFLGFRNGLTTAALSEIDEVEMLLPGATVQTLNESTFDDFQLNLGTSRHQRPVWAAIGWRHVELDENSSLLATGIFQAIDTDDGALPGGVGDGGNNGLANLAFTTAGFTAIAGPADGFTGFDPTMMMPVMTTVGALFQGTTDNDLDGGQIVIGGRIQPRDLIILEGFLNLGLFHNRVEGTVTETVFGVVNDTSVYRRSFTADDTVASFVGGLGFKIIVPVTDYIFFHTGYEGLLITNLALGPDQSQGLGTTLLGTPFYKVQTGGHIVAHGGNAGFQVTW